MDGCRKGKAQEWIRGEKSNCKIVQARRLLRVPWRARRTNQSILKEISPWIFIGRTDVEPETPKLWPPDAKNWFTGKDPDAGKDWRQEKKGNDKGWDGWMASPTQWTWVWVNSGSWWWTERPGVLHSMGSQRVGHNWATGLNWVSSVGTPEGASRKGAPSKELVKHTFWRQSNTCCHQSKTTWKWHCPRAKKNNKL